MTHVWMRGRVRPSHPTRRHAAAQDTPSDEVLAALLAACARSDLAAFARLYDATAPRMFGLVSRMTADRAPAEEVTVQAYVQVWRTCHRFDPRTDVALAWMLDIAHHQSMLWLRAPGATDQQDHPLRARPPAFSVTGARADRAARSRVRQSLPHWTRAQRNAFIACYFGRHAPADIATLSSVRR